MYDEFQERDTTVIAVAQEDTDLKSHGKFLRHFGSSPPFDIVADLGRKKTKRYHRTTAYLIDKTGTIVAKPVCHRWYRWYRQNGTSYSFYNFLFLFSKNFYKKERFACTSCATCVLPL